MGAGVHDPPALDRRPRLGGAGRAARGRGARRRQAPVRLGDAGADAPAGAAGLRDEALARLHPAVRPLPRQGGHGRDRPFGRRQGDPAWPRSIADLASPRFLSP